jgi:hypothetical protein
VPSRTTPTRHLPTSGLALAHGHDAAGASDLRPGFAFTTEDDLRFALGFPHFESLTDEVPSDPAEAVLDVYRNHLFECREWPRAVALRLVRAMCAPPRTIFDPVRGTIAPDAKGRAILERSDPFTEAEASRLLREVTTMVGTTPGVLEKIVLLCEALVGSEAVLSALIDVVQAWPDERWHAYDRVAYATTLLFAPLLLRIHRVGGEPQRRRLVTLFESIGGRGLGRRSGPGTPPVRALDLVLHAREGALRSVSPWPDRAELRWVRGAPEIVIERLRAMNGPGESIVDARLAFVGGDEALELERSWWSKYREPTGAGDAQRAFIATHGRIQSHKIAEIIVEMASRSRAKKQAVDWLLAHAELSRVAASAMAAEAGERRDWGRRALDRLSRAR